MTSIVIEKNLDQRRRIFGVDANFGRVLPFAKRREVGANIYSDHVAPIYRSAIYDSVDAPTAISEALPP